MLFDIIIISLFIFCHIYHKLFSLLSVLLFIGFKLQIGNFLFLIFFNYYSFALVLTKSHAICLI